MREIFSDYLSKVIQMRQAQIRYRDSKSMDDKAFFFAEKTRLQKEVDRLNNDLIDYLAMESITAVL